MVKEGQLLVQIDTAPYRAALNAAAANLEQAQASATNAKVTAERNRELAKQSLVSKMQLDDSQALERSSAAQVSAAKAQVETARINLSYANVTAPISGRAGQMRVLEGALVGQGEATLLTTVEQVDPIYVFFDQPASDFERLRRAQAAGQVTIAEGDLAEVRVIRADGSEYPHAGYLSFSDFSVNPTTGAVAFRGVIPNPDRLLLPGMYVNVRLTAGMLKRGFEVPQLAVQRDAPGRVRPGRGCRRHGRGQARRRRELGRRELGHRRRPRGRRPGGRLRHADGASGHEGEPQARGRGAAAARRGRQRARGFAR